MIRLLQFLTALMLAGLLALTSVTMAVARGQVGAYGQVVLCSAAGEAVPLGPDGLPAGPAHICPDCALSLFVGLTSPPPVVAPRNVGWRFAVWVETPDIIATRAPVRARARAPPLSTI